MLGTVFRLFCEYKPLKFFSFWALLLFLCGSGFMVPVLIDYFNMGLVPRFPTLFVCVGLFIIAALLLACGVILHVVAKKHKMLFELLMNRRPD